MTLRLLVLCAGFAIVPCAAHGQDSLATPADIDKFRATLKAEVLSEMRAIIREELAAASRQTDTAPDGLEAVEKRLADAEGDIADLGNMLGKVTARSETGDIHLRFDTKSQQARTEFSRALNSTVPEKGWLVIHNRTNSDQYLIINDEQQLVLAGARLRLEVQPGTFTTRLRHEQRPLTWYVGFPKYYQGIDILERSPAPARWVAMY